MGASTMEAEIRPFSMYTFSSLKPLKDRIWQKRVIVDGAVLVFARVEME